MFSYTNRKDVTYYLHESRTKTGKVRYTLKRSAEGAAAKRPPGYEVVENVNGKASVRKVRPRRITSLEEKLVQGALESHGLNDYRVEVKANFITVFEPDRDADEMAKLADPFAMWGALGAALQSEMRKELGDAAVDGYVQSKKDETRRWIQQRMTYSPVLRFRLCDESRRVFEVERMTYLGDGGWWTLDRLPLTEAVESYLPHLGQESFFDLY